MPGVKRGQTVADMLYSNAVMTEYGCLEWKRGRLPKGYGRVRWRGRQTIASRVSLEIKLGRPVQPDMFACHTCDNPPCILPDHLYEGTRSDNERDKYTPAQERYLAAIRSTA